MAIPIVLIILSAFAGIFYYPSPLDSFRHSYLQENLTEYTRKILKLIAVGLNACVTASMIVFAIIFRENKEKASAFCSITFLAQFLFFGLIYLSIVYIIAAINKRKR